MRQTCMILTLMILCILAIVAPVSAVQTGNLQGMLTQVHSPASTNAFLANYQTQKPVVTVWQPSIRLSLPVPQALIPENQLISSYAALTSGGNVLSYPGGLAASMGGGGCGGS